MGISPSIIPYLESVFALLAHLITSFSPLHPLWGDSPLALCSQYTTPYNYTQIILQNHETPESTSPSLFCFSPQTISAFLPSPFGPLSLLTSLHTLDILHSFFLHSFSLFFCTVASHVCTLHPVHMCVCLWGCCPFNVCRRTHMPCDMEHIQFKTGLCLFMCSRNIYNQNQPCFTHKSGQICTIPWKHKVAYVRWPLRSPYSVLNSVAVARHIPL